MYPETFEITNKSSVLLLSMLCRCLSAWLRDLAELCKDTFTINWSSAKLCTSLMFLGTCLSTYIIWVLDFLNLRRLFLPCTSEHSTQLKNTCIHFCQIRLLVLVHHELFVVRMCNQRLATSLRGECDLVQFMYVCRLLNQPSRGKGFAMRVQRGLFRLK